ncbi:probable cysteine--tRNA ligase, mitochondrial isoform X3 [Theropithecus gelada]|uniref:probable cysteine--tRNA ligase, mitochondrial isoform X3 n=1 Tax=Theropithecus gelada TaxID=9565 RepID=UPI000DC1B237|nr:probable cysteine--tRNA ligase, mitochondrial isoform X3 [Theropithecus gelada]
MSQRNGVRSLGNIFTEMNISPASLASLYEEDFKQDMAALKVLPPTVYLRVTENIPQIISFIEGIIARGHAYSTAKGNVYFDLKSRGDKYGKLVGVVPGPVGEPADSDKRHASDFALWKAAKPQEVFWASPWGPGRPGWHIECSAIASMVFGSQLDIHSGGIDLAFPHHENEIAQCEVFHQCEQWGNYFLHSGHLHVKGKEEKMSKSLKNYITIKDFLKTFSPDVFRFFCLRSSYRSAIDYSDSAMLQAQQQLLALGCFLEDARAYMKGQLACGSVREVMLWERLASTKRAVKEALADDFDTPRVVDAILGLARHGNGQLRATSKEPGVPRSPAVFGAIISYFEQFFETVGISLGNQQVANPYKLSCAEPEMSPSQQRGRQLCTHAYVERLSECAEVTVCFRRRQRGHLAWCGGGAGAVPAEGPAVCTGQGRGHGGGPTAAAPREAAPAGGMRHPAPGPDCPWHQHQGQKQYNVHVGTAGSKDKRPKTSGLRMQHSHEPAHDKMHLCFMLKALC